MIRDVGARLYPSTWRVEVQWAAKYREDELLSLWSVNYITAPAAAAAATTTGRTPPAHNSPEEFRLCPLLIWLLLLVWAIATNRAGHTKGNKSHSPSSAWPRILVLFMLQCAGNGIIISWLKILAQPSLIAYSLLLLLLLFMPRLSVLS